MPTTQEEAATILKISHEYFPAEKLKELFTRLDEEVGKKTENDSLKKSLQMMRMLVDPPMPPPPLWLWGAFYSLVITHFVLVIAEIASFFALPFLADWYIAIPSMTFLFFFTTSRNDCQLTNLENLMRRRLGMKRIGGFVGHYCVRPIKALIWKGK
jgi:hypothetical protein